MSLIPFIDELTESRMFHDSKDLKKMPVNEIAEIVFLIFMMMEVIRAQNKSWVSTYASETLRYSTYDNMHYSGTDLGNLLAVLNNQDTFKHDIKGVPGISIPLFQINRYLRSIESRHDYNTDDSAFFWRLDEYLKLSSSNVRQLRRDVSQFKELSHADRTQFIMYLRREFDKRASSVDIYLWFKQSFKLKDLHESVISDSDFTITDNTNHDLHELKQYWEDKGIYLSLSVYNDGSFEVSKVIVPEDSRNQGYGTQVMQSLTDYADKNNATIWLSPSTDFGGSSVTRLKSFYKRFGFVDNKGRNKDYRRLASMLRLPKNESVEESIDTKLAYHNKLNPMLWDKNDELHEDVKDALAKIANKFSEFVDVKQLKIVDYIITGSNCNFNYTSQSDIDVHVLVDATNLGKNPLTEPFLAAKKSLWNSGHDITVKGYNVELYAEDVNKKENQLVATGVYSLLQDKWLKKPSHLDIDINDPSVAKKAEDIMNRIDLAIEAHDEADIEKLRVHIYKMRSAGLDAGGEFSVENLAFKAIRNNGYLDKMKEFDKSSEDRELSLEDQVITEGLNQDTAIKIVDRFIQFAVEHLQLSELPAIDLQRDNGVSIKHKSFGGYSNGEIKVTLTNRHVMDVCRTLAHELVHFKQDLNDELDIDSGETGSDQENEANAQAAIIMRKWGKKHPYLFAQQAVE